MPGRTTKMRVRMRSSVLLIVFALLGLTLSTNVTEAANKYPHTSFVVDTKRPATVYPPAFYKGPAPILISLHGYTSSGSGQESYMKMKSEASKRGVIYVLPNGTKDGAGNAFWNAGNSCCNFFGSKVDDVGYLMGLINQVNAKYPVDRKRIYFMGHSNGGFMTYRMACERSKEIAAVIIFSGSVDTARPNCKPIPISVLHIHGSADTTISTSGAQLTSNSSVFASVANNLAFWSTVDSCGKTDPLPNKSSSLDLVSDLAGSETSTYKFICSTKASLEYWNIEGGSHVPNLNSTWAPRIFDFLLSQHK
jgi:polyhydroxybutyrate depolymerase